MFHAKQAALWGSPTSTSRYTPFFSCGAIFSPLNSFQGQQYVCAGELAALQMMVNVLNYLRVQEADLAKVGRALFVASTDTCIS